MVDWKGAELWGRGVLVLSFWEGIWFFLEGVGGRGGVGHRGGGVWKVGNWAASGQGIRYKETK